MKFIRICKSRLNESIISIKCWVTSFKIYPTFIPDK